MMLRRKGDEEWLFILPHSAFSRATGARANNLQLRARPRLHPRSRLRASVDGQHVSHGCQSRSASVRTSTDISLLLLALPITSTLFLAAVLPSWPFEFQPKTLGFSMELLVPLM